jgi:metallo-beta-lactamase class B
MKPIICFFFLLVHACIANVFAQKTINPDHQIVYRSDKLVIAKLSQHVYQHTSFLNTESFGRVPCNGMIVVNQKQAIVFDTPATDSASSELIDWVVNDLHNRIKAVIPTHFHDDCLGGLTVFSKKGIPSYANQQTIILAKQKGSAVPEKGFTDSLSLSIGNQKVYALFFGEGHTADNVVGYFPQDNILFGGCLIKEINADKGYLGDANTNEWPATVAKIKKRFPKLAVVIPGHGETGGENLLDYTIQLFTNR